MRNLSSIMTMLVTLIFVFFIDVEASEVLNLCGEMNWEKLLSVSKSINDKNKIQRLKELISLDEAHFLLCNLSSLEKPEDILKLSDLEKEQNERGGGFFGIIPDYFQNRDSIPKPSNWSSLLDAAIFLSEIRSKNFEIVLNPAFKYQVSFINNPLPNLKSVPCESAIDLMFDFSVIEGLLSLFDKQDITRQDAYEIANNPIFIQMLKHRRELGYILEPLPEVEDLSEFIFYAASTEPVHQLWKWINPFNLFSLADLYLKNEKYRKYLNHLKKNENRILNHVEANLIQYLPDGFSFRCSIAFAVNWGIRSWATNTSLGTNICSYKDDYKTLLMTITHEIFHKIQQNICSVASTNRLTNVKKFEDIVNYHFDDERDSKFYETLSYIVLEGSATLVGGIEDSLNIEQKMTDGIRLLSETYQLIYETNEIDKVEDILVQGLKSNGPYYILGYVMSKKLIDKYGKKILGKLLKHGTIPFFNKYLNIEKEYFTANDLVISSAVHDKIAELMKYFSDGS